MATVEFRNVSKRFPGDVIAVQDLSLTIGDGEFVVFVGPSGCGKSTALRMLAGLEDITKGDILIAGKQINGLPPEQRNIAMIFQDYALYPHKTVRKNLEFPLRMMRFNKQERSRRVTEAARLLGLSPLLERKPKELSGGQRQRVAMGRAIVRDPLVFLMDEPLSNLDAKLRVEIRAEIAALQKRVGITTIYVTHDQVEAMTLGDRVAVLRGGRLQQIAAARVLYEQPVNVFVASFIGSPRMNVFRTILRQNGSENKYAVEFGDLRLPVNPDRCRDPDRLREYAGRPMLGGLRPEAFQTASGAPKSQCFTTDIRTIEALGHEEIVYCNSPVEMMEPAEQNNPNEEVRTPSESTVIARLPAGQIPGIGESITLGIDATQMLLFTEQGTAI